jgi:hypothetical protein
MHMQNKELEKYITKAYARLLDYSTYHCSRQGLVGEEVDVLNEVMADLMKKEESYLLELMHRKKNGYTELDFLILDMIKTYTMSDTAPYRHRYRNRIQVDDNVKDLSRLDLIDEEYQDVDHNAEILEQMRMVREIVAALELSEKAYRIFSWKFFEGEAFSEWPGDEDKAYLYEVYNKVLEMVKDRIKGEVLF